MQFETMIEVKPETKKYLTNWRPPRWAYILFETRETQLFKEKILDEKGQSVLDADGKPTYIDKSRPGTGLYSLCAEHRPDVGDKLNYALRKGHRIIHYGNFPKVNDANPQRARLARMHTSPNGICAWDELERKVRQMMTINPNWQDEKSALEKKLAEAQLQLEAKNGRTNSQKDSAAKAA